MNKHIQSLDPSSISERHIKQLVSLLMTTGYFEYIGMGNKLNLNYYEATKHSFVLPSIENTKVIFDDLNNIAGFYVASTKASDSKRKLDPSAIRDDLNVHKAISAIYSLNNMIHDDDYILSYFAVRFDLHGLIYKNHTKKISELLFDNLLLEAKQSSSSSLNIITWASHVAAVKLYQRFNGNVVETIDLNDSIFRDKLLLIKIKL